METASNPDKAAEYVSLFVWIFFFFLFIAVLLVIAGHMINNNVSVGLLHFYGFSHLMSNRLQSFSLSVAFKYYMFLFSNIAFHERKCSYTRLTRDRITAYIPSREKKNFNASLFDIFSAYFFYENLI